MGKKKSKSTKKKPAALRNRELPLEKLRTEENFLKYVKLLKLFAKKYCVMIVASDTPVGPDTTREMSVALLEMGLRIDLYGKYRCAYAAMIDAGDVIFEKLDSSAIVQEITVRSKKVKLISIEYKTPITKGLVLIDGKNYALNRRGLNIVVYDKSEEAVLDVAAFDTYLPEAVRCTTYKNQLDLKEYIKTHPDIMVVCAQVPKFPINPVTSIERLIPEQFITLDNLSKQPPESYPPWFALNKYYDKAGITEVLTPPKSYLDTNGVRRFEDTHGKYVNTSGGHRETAYQPEKFQRTIFLLGGCKIFGVGSDDSRTIASYLQKQCNLYMPDAGLIVQNYGFYLLNRELGEYIDILNGLPAKPGDIIIYNSPTDSPIWIDKELPNIDLLLLGEEPRTYEMFFDCWHYTPDGNRLIAERLFEGLVDLGVLQQNKTVSSDRPGSDLINTRDFADYLRLIKKYAQKYCVVVSSWEAAAGFTEELSGLYREVGFQADLIEKPDCAYAAVMDAGELVYEELCEGHIEVTLTDEEPRFEANIVSRGPGSEPLEKSPIAINGNNCSSKRRGAAFCRL